jgi:hypothetical protein
MRLARYISLIVLVTFAIAISVGHRWTPSNYQSRVHAQSSNSCSRSSIIVPVNIDEIIAGHDSPVHICATPQDSVLWYSDSYKFKITSVSPKDTGAPQNAFYRVFPNSADAFQQTVSSGPARGASAGHTYKVTFQLEDGTVVDPEVEIIPPPQ